MSFSVASLPSVHQEFAAKVCQSIYDGSIARLKGDFVEPTLILADGTESPNNERYIAERLYCSWKLYFDFKEGKVYRVSIQLPDECAGK